ncbi:MAG TPA: LamG domain-containing protein [Kofleriaceae bacterium]
MHRPRGVVAGIVSIAAVLAACGAPEDEATGGAGAAPGIDPGASSGAAGTKPRCEASAGDDRRAQTMALACGRLVEIESARSEYSELYVDPSGSRTLVTSVVPRRARHPDGAWGAIDLTLRQVGDVVAPTATAAKVQFSSGGGGPLVTATAEGHSMTLSWPAPLPRPTLSGASATYADVLPDVDLVVTATDAGFTHALVVKTARAAANPAVRHARYRLGGDATLTTTAEGGLVAEAAGVRVASAEPALMWDTTPRSAARASVAGEAGVAPVRTAWVASTISGGNLTLSPAAAMLDDPAARYPLVIDPPWVVGQNQWAYASADNQNGPTTDSKVASGDPSPAAPELRVGNDPDSTHQYRSFMRFSINGLAGKQILGAKIAGRVDHTWKCGSNRPTYFYRSDGINAAPRQGWPGPPLRVLLGNNNVHANEADCNEPNMGFEVSTGALINDVQAYTNAGAANYYIAISAGENTSGTNETLTDRYARYFLNEFTLQITYNTKPNTPDNLTVDGKPCASGAARPFIKTTTPTLRAHVTDADNDTLNVFYAWAQWNGSGFVDQAGGEQDFVPNGGTAVFGITGNVDGGIYTWRAQTNDGASHNPFLVSDVTASPGNCEWQVDISPPAVPAVTGDVYKEGPTGCPGGACGGVGQTGRFTLSSSPDTQAFLWGFSDPPTNPVSPTTLGGSVDVTWTPDSSGPQTLFVRAIDRAGNESNRTYQFVVTGQSTAVARWLFDEPAGATPGDDTGHGHALTLVKGTLGAPGRLVPGLDGQSRSAMQLDGSGDGAVTSGAVLANPGGSFSLAAWVKITDVSATHNIIAQVDSPPTFVLEHSKGDGIWKLTAPSADWTQFPGPGAISPVRAGTWTHLVGTYDAIAHEMKLYVNGALEATYPGVTVRSGSNALKIGSQGFSGSIAEVQVWGRPISAAEVFALVDPIATSNVGEWHMDEVGPGPAFDASPMAHDLTFFNGASIPASGAGHTGTGLRLDGLDDFAATSKQVLHTDQSYTVSVWAHPASSTAMQTFVSQDSMFATGGFSLKYGPDGGGLWKFRIHASATDVDGTHITFCTAPITDPTTAYHHLVGVFDAERREARLYVDGVLKMTSAMNAAWQPWDATGPLVIGRHQQGSTVEFTRGDVDEVHVYQGVVTDVTRIP